ncbi:MAG: hypothetical protein AAFZ80_13110 [Cyanobacteria bacterium P01_A01_bin.105]
MIRFPKPLAGGVLALSLVMAGCQTQDIADPAAPSPGTEDVAEGTAGDAASDSNTVADDASTDADPGAVNPAETPVTAQPDNAGEGNTGDSNTGDGTTTSGDTIAVAIYVMDEQCNTYEKKTIEVEPDQAMSQAVGQVMTVTQDYNKFELAGYRLSYDADSDTATVDLRLSPDSERQLFSLSSCEQRSLFGSVQETLTQNPDWAIETVEFTDRGKELLM